MPRLLVAGALARLITPLVRPWTVRRLRRQIFNVNADLVLLLKCDDLPVAFYDALRDENGLRLAVFHPDAFYKLSAGRFGTPAPSDPCARLQNVRNDVDFTWSRRFQARLHAERSRGRRGNLGSENLGAS
ncbi:MAG: hypothetical protein ACI8PT_004458 [Gammaproteobacteria bacterium]|jgi:hypothetical protein